MIGSWLGTTDLLVTAIYGVTCWVMGVVYAAYRAVGWVEKWRAWAHALPSDDVEELT